MDNKITVSILTHRCQCPHDRLKRGGDRGGATNIHKRKLSSEPHVKKRYKWRNHLFYTPGQKKKKKFPSKPSDKATKRGGAHLYTRLYTGFMYITRSTISAFDRRTICDSTQTTMYMYEPSAALALPP